MGRTVRGSRLAATFAPNELYSWNTPYLMLPTELFHGPMMKGQEQVTLRI